MRESLGQCFAKRVIHRFPASMEALRSGHGLPRVFHCQHGSEGFDGVSTHVNDERKVVSVAVSLNFEALDVNPSARQGSTQAFVVQELSLIHI